MNDMAVTNLTSTLAWADFQHDQDLIQSLETVVLPPYINTCRWFAGKARQQESFRIRVVHEISLKTSIAFLLIIDVRYADGETESYQLPLSFIETDGRDTTDILPKGIITTVHFGQDRGILVDAIYDERFRQALFQHLAGQDCLPQADGQLCFNRGRGLADDDTRQPIANRVLPVDSSNSALVFGEKYFMKLYRKLFEETNPEVDMVSFMTEQSNFSHIPAYAGSIVWQQEEAGASGRSGQTDITLGLMQRMVQNEKDCWDKTGDYLNDFLFAVPTRHFSIKEDVFDMVEMLGRRTAEMHLALYKPDADLDFAPEHISDAYREFIIHRLQHLLERRYNLLIDHYLTLDSQAQALAWIFMEAKELIDSFIDDFRNRPLDSLRIRIHGDYHLGQVLATGTDYIILDFEGEPESSISDRKIKHSPLKDVAGMIRSYHYAVSAKLFNSVETAHIDPVHLQRVSDRWFKLIRDTYMDAYLDTFGQPHPLFKDNSEVNFLLLVYLLEKAVYELGYEISYRPAWVKIPLRGIVDVIREIEKLAL